MKSTDAINIAQQEIGVKESPPNSNNVKYNTWYYGREVHDGDKGPKAKYPWCAAFISWLFKNEQSLCPKSASCENLLNWFEQRGQIVQAPLPGDLVFFKYKTNNRKTNHIGIVKQVTSLNVVTIEGNTSVTSDDNGGCVMERVRRSNIVGYARPKYSDSTTKATNVATASSKPTLRLGSKGDDVTYLQLRLQVLKYDPGKADGDFGPKTKEAVMKFQESYGLTKDGIIGKKTWAKLYP